MEPFQVKLMKTRALLILSILCSISGSSQVSTSRLEGTIQDSSGAVIPRAKIEAVNVKTQAGTSTTSDGEGHFIFASLAPSEYTLSVEAVGFRKAIRNGLM